jgi:WD40 repeat protein
LFYTPDRRRLFLSPRADSQFPVPAFALDKAGSAKALVVARDQVAVSGSRGGLAFWSAKERIWRDGKPASVKSPDLLAMSPDGAWVAATDTKTLVVSSWQTSNGEAAWSVPLPQAEPGAPESMPANRVTELVAASTRNSQTGGVLGPLAILGDSAGRVRVLLTGDPWSWARARATPSPHGEAVRAIALRPDDPDERDKSIVRFASGASDGSVAWWRVQGGELQLEGRAPQNHHGDVYALEFGRTAAGKKVLLSAGEDAQVRTRDLGSGAARCTLHEHRSRVLSLAVEPRGGQWVLSREDDRVAVLWNLTNCEVARVFHDIEEAAFLAPPSGEAPRDATQAEQLVLTLTRQGNVELPEGPEPLPREGDSHAPGRATFLNEQELLAANDLGLARRWKGDDLAEATISAGSRGPEVLAGNGGHAVSISPAGHTTTWTAGVAAPPVRGSIEPGEGWWVRAAALSPDPGRPQLVTIDEGSGGALRARFFAWAEGGWKPDRMADLGRCPQVGADDVPGASTDHFFAASWGPSGAHVLHSDPQGHACVFQDIAVKPRSVSVSNDLMRELEPADHAHFRRLLLPVRTDPRTPVTAGAIAPSGRAVLLALESGEVRSVYLGSDGTIAKSTEKAEAHKGAVRSAAFHPDGRFAVTGGDDGAVLLWDVEEGRFMRLGAQPTPVLWAAFRPPNGDEVVTGAAGGSVLAWVTGTRSSDPLGILCNLQKWLRDPPKQNYCKLLGDKHP